MNAHGERACAARHYPRRVAMLESVPRDQHQRLAITLAKLRQRCEELAIPLHRLGYGPPRGGAAQTLEQRTATRTRTEMIRGNPPSDPKQPRQRRAGKPAEAAPRNKECLRPHILHRFRRPPPRRVTTDGLPAGVEHLLKRLRLRPIGAHKNTLSATTPDLTNRKDVP